MSADAEKHKMMRSVDYDPENGLGSIAATYQDARNIMESITYANVKDFLERQKSRQN
jgi:hypothetical protein